MSTQTSLFGESEPERKKSKVPPKVEEILGEGFDVKKFVENFETILEATEGPKKLKELVLHLAVSGRLLAASRETAEPFLKGLQKSRATLAESGIRCRSDYAPVAAEEYPYSVPEGWRWLRVGELGGFLGGGTPSKSNNAFWKGAIPWVSPKDMKRPFIDDAEDHISEAAVQGSAAKLVPSPSVLFVLRGMILAHSFPVAVTRRTVAINQDMRALVLAYPEMQTFVLRVFQAARDRVLANIERSSHGTCRLDAMVVENLPIAIPPLAEQKRIVAKVDELMALIDDLETKQTKKREVGARLTKSALDALTSAEGPEECDAAWKRVVENFDVLIDRAGKVAEVRANIVELAMRGRLTRSASGDRNVADDLVVRTRAPGFSGKGQLAPIDDDAPFSVPGTWTWVRWGTLSEGTSSGWSPQCESRSRVGSEWGVLKVSAVSWFSFRSEENKALPLALEPRPEFAVRPGDFLMSRANTAELVGRSVVVEETPKRLILSDKIIRCEFCALVEKQFLNLFNRTTAAREHYVRHASGTSDSMKNISREVILTMPIPLPPIEEQRRIVTKVNSLMKICDELEAKLRHSEERAAKLAEAAVRELVA